MAVLSIRLSLMRKTLVYLFLLLGIHASAQIVIKQNQYPSSVLGTDTIKISSGAAVFPALGALAGGLWDMTALSDSVSVFYDYRTSTTGYDYADNSIYYLWRYAYRGNNQSSIVAAGILDYGITVQDTSYNISLLTTSAFDSIFIPGQTIAYSSPRVKLPFNTTYGDSWSSAYTRDLGFALSTDIPVLYHAPGFVRSYISVVNNVVGWGQVKVNDINGLPGTYLDVLQIQTMTITRDSFFLNGGLMPGTLLTLFGVYQGKTDTVFEQKYQRQGEVTPLVNVQFKDNAFTQPIRARRHVQRLYPFTDGIRYLTSSRLLAYPNPVTGSVLKVNVDEGFYEYSFTDIIGCVVSSGHIKVTSTGNELILPPAIVNGSYYLHLSSNGSSQTIPVEVFR